MTIKNNQFAKKLINTFTKNKKLKKSEIELMREFDQFIAQGRINEGILSIKEILRRSPSSIPLNILLHSLLVQTQHKSMLAQHTKTFLPLLIKMESYDIAADVYIAAHRLNNNCKPNDPDCYYHLANELRKRNHSKTAINLLKDFHKKFKNNPNTARNYLLVAEIYAEDLQDQLRAKKILSFIHQTWPTSQWAKQAKKYYRLVNKIVQNQLLSPISTFA